MKIYKTEKSRGVPWKFFSLQTETIWLGRTRKGAAAPARGPRCSCIAGSVFDLNLHLLFTVIIIITNSTPVFASLALLTPPAQLSAHVPAAVAPAPSTSVTIPSRSTSRNNEHMLFGHIDLNFDEKNNYLRKYGRDQKQNLTLPTPIFFVKLFHFVSAWFWAAKFGLSEDSFRKVQVHILVTSPLVWLFKVWVTESACCL